MRHGMLVTTAAAALLSFALSGSRALAQAPASPGTDDAAGHRRAEALKKFDKNGDGKLDPTERAAMKSAAKEKEQVKARKASLEEKKAKLLKKYDQNGDGKLDPSERTAARSAAGKPPRPSAIARSAKGPQNAPSAQSAPSPQSAEAIRQKIHELQGQIKTEEQKLQRMNQRASQRRAETLKKFDKNGDGKLDQDEKTAAREAAKTRRPAESKPF